MAEAQMADTQEKLRHEAQQAANVCKRGGVIVYPTDTVWGIGCDATNSEAVRRVFEIKYRADHKALIVLVGSEAMLERTVEEVPEVAYQLLEAAIRPTTIVYDQGRGLSPELLGPDGSVGVRLASSDEFCRELCQRLGRPVVSTSANVSGQPTAANFCDISQEILDAVDYVVDLRRDEQSEAQPSSVIKISSGGLIKILR